MIANQYSIHNRLLILVNVRIKPLECWASRTYSLNHTADYKRIHIRRRTTNHATNLEKDHHRREEPFYVEDTVCFPPTVRDQPCWVPRGLGCWSLRTYSGRIEMVPTASAIPIHGSFSISPRVATIGGWMSATLH